MLLAMNEYNKCCFAKHAEKGKKYYCRGCRKRVILKKGKKKCAHFA
ncbi:competence protein CoiA, partial [Enterococcus faecium]